MQVNNRAALFAGRDGDERPVLELVGPEADIPSDLEVAHIPFALGGPYPGLFLFTQVRIWQHPAGASYSIVHGVGS